MKTRTFLNELLECFMADVHSMNLRVMEMSWFNRANNTQRMAKRVVYPMQMLMSIDIKLNCELKKMQFH